MSKAGLTQRDSAQASDHSLAKATHAQSCGTPAILGLTLCVNLPVCLQLDLYHPYFSTVASWHKGQDEHNCLFSLVFRGGPESKPPKGALLNLKGSECNIFTLFLQHRICTWFARPLSGRVKHVFTCQWHQKRPSHS